MFKSFIIDRLRTENASKKAFSANRRFGNLSIMRSFAKPRNHEQSRMIICCLLCLFSFFSFADWTSTDRGIIETIRNNTSAINTNVKLIKDDVSTYLPDVGTIKGYVHDQSQWVNNIKANVQTIVDGYDDLLSDVANAEDYARQIRNYTRDSESNLDTISATCTLILNAISSGGGGGSGGDITIITNRLYDYRPYLTTNNTYLSSIRDILVTNTEFVAAIYDEMTNHYYSIVLDNIYTSLTNSPDYTAALATNNLYLARISESLTNLNFEVYATNLDYTAYLVTNNLFVSDIARSGSVATQILNQISGYCQTNAHILMQCARVSDEVSADGYSPALALAVTNTFEAIMLTKIYSAITNLNLSSASFSVWSNMTYSFVTAQLYSEGYTPGTSIATIYSDLSRPNLRAYGVLSSFARSGIWGLFPHLLLNLIDFQSLDDYELDILRTWIEYNAVLTDVAAANYVDYQLEETNLSYFFKKFYGTEAFTSNFSDYSSVALPSILSISNSVAGLSGIVGLNLDADSVFDGGAYSDDMKDVVAGLGGNATSTLALAYQDVPSNRVDQDTSQYANSTISGLLDVDYNEFSSDYLDSVRPFFEGVQDCMFKIEDLKQGSSTFTITYSPYFRIGSASVPTIAIPIDATDLRSRILTALRFFFFCLKVCVTFYFAIMAWRYLVNHRILQ